MPWRKLFASTVERKLATRLVLVLLLPLALLSVLATQQVQTGAQHFTDQHLATEAKDYGMLLVERLRAATLLVANKQLDEPLTSVDDTRLPLRLAGSQLYVSLAPLGVKHVEMPATPHRIWQAIQAAKS